MIAKRLVEAKGKTCKVLQVSSLKKITFVFASVSPCVFTASLNRWGICPRVFGQAALESGMVIVKNKEALLQRASLFFYTLPA